jgi:D-alanyl-D-alanine carboxypeptidase
MLVKRARLVAVGLAAAAGFVATSSAGSAEPSAPPPVARVAQDVVRQGARGVIVYVSTPGKEYAATAGAERPGANQRFRAGSITKTFTAAIVLQLVQEGKLGLGDTLEQHLPGVVPRGRDITVRQLLRHQSGLENYTNLPHWPWLKQALGSAATRPIDILRYAGSQPLVVEPGSAVMYSNTNYIALGLVIEQVTGSSYADELQRRILDPLGLDHTELPSTRSPSEVEEDEVAADEPDWRNPIAAWAAGSIVSTTRDLARFYSALLAGRVVSPASLATMKEGVGIGPGTRLGLGIFALDVPCGVSWGHTGKIHDSSTLAIATARGERVVVVATRDRRNWGPDLSSVPGKLLCADSGPGAQAPTPCRKGSVPAVIEGKRTCLRAGQRCKRKLDRRYHRYGFHCHGGRLTRRASKPSPREGYLAPAAAPQACSAGGVPAKIEGNRVCLKVGHRCKRALDRKYHAYGFHCHDGRLARAIFSRRIDVGGFKLAITCRGLGSPTVVLESGAGWGSSAWYLLEPRLETTTRVCSYDRAGMGGSDDRRPPGPAPAARVVEELHRLLVRAGIRPPYVLGGWSLGGFFNRLYAMRYPGEVAGLVSVDGTPIGLPGNEWLNPPGQPPIDLIGGPGLPDSYYLAAGGDELAAAPSLGVRPLVVLTHGSLPPEVPPDFEALWSKWQKEIALLSSSSILVRADNAGHGIQLDAPALTAEAFRQVIAAVRAHAPLRACAATPLPRLGATCLDPAERGSRGRKGT